MNQTVLQVIINSISTYAIGIPRYLSTLSIFSWLVKDNALNLDGLGDDISTIDPFFIDNFRYNPADGRWYESPPQPDYGQYGWTIPADDNTQTKLTFLRDVSHVGWAKKRCPPYMTRLIVFFLNQKSRNIKNI